MVQKEHLVRGLFVKESRPSRPKYRDPILMIPGGSHGWWAYEKWLACFADAGWTSYALSLRNHTGSYEVPAEKYLRLGVKDYVADVQDVLDWIETGVVLIGHSMGGIIAQKVAEARALKALVLVAPVGPGQLGAIRDALPTDRPVMFSPEAVRSSWFYEIDDEQFSAIYERLVPESPSVMNEYSGGKVHVDRSRLRCPILVMAGEHDRSVVHKTQAVGDFYGAPFMILPNCGHDLMLEPMAAAAAEYIQQWLLTVL